MAVRRQRTQEHVQRDYDRLHRHVRLLILANATQRLQVYGLPSTTLRPRNNVVEREGLARREYCSAFEATCAV